MQRSGRYTQCCVSSRILLMILSCISSGSVSGKLCRISESPKLQPTKIGEIPNYLLYANPGFLLEYLVSTIGTPANNRYNTPFCATSACLVLWCWLIPRSVLRLVFLHILMSCQFKNGNCYN
jgi:hypothetical protein